MDSKLSQFAAKSLQSCPTLCDPIDDSPPGSPVPGVLQARTLEWVAISFSNAGKWKVKVKSLSRVRLLATPWTAAHQAPPSMGFSRQEYWSGCHCLLRLYLLDLLFSVLSAKHISSLFKSFQPAQQCDCLEVEVTLRSFSDRFAHMFLSSVWGKHVAQAAIIPASPLVLLMCPGHWRNSPFQLDFVWPSSQV